MVKTVDEREALLDELKTLNTKGEWDPRAGHSPNGLKAIRRVINELAPGDGGGDSAAPDGEVCSCGSLAVGEGADESRCPHCGDVIGGDA